MTATSLRLRRIDLAEAATDSRVAAEREALLRRGAVPDERVREIVRGILADVRSRGAAAVRETNARVGGGLPDGQLIIDRSGLRAAGDALEPRVRSAIEAAITNVRRFAETQRPVSARTEIAPGVEIERRWTPLESVGCYVPGGTAPLPSSLVMTVVPAQVAGVERIVVATPAGPRGSVDAVVLGAAALLGVDAVLVAGGAQAIAALAYGLPDDGFAPVDRIVGPGSAWVTAAKIELAGEVGIDLPAGPSEGLVLADASADPRFVAADLLTQAEHGPDSPAILVTDDAAFADAVEAELGRRLATEPRAGVLERSLGAHGRVILAPSLDAAIDFVNAYGPEHLSVELADADLEPAVARLRNAGSLFVGRWAPESAGDYATGANHVLPTGGLARSCGPLSVEQFGKFTQVQRITREGLTGLRATIGTLATAEGLHAHAAAVDVRFAPETDR
ncbi:MAG TPA: histidinol dehydrogenase [Candidatus Saccharimonadales bacterium]|nr:histidinol dehydrogenase [Candidatus Saccharimonadales bacterium]